MKVNFNVFIVKYKADFHNFISESPSEGFYFIRESELVSKVSFVECVI